MSWLFVQSEESLRGTGAKLLWTVFDKTSKQDLDQKLCLSLLQYENRCLLTIKQQFASWNFCKVVTPRPLGTFCGRDRLFTVLTNLVPRVLSNPRREHLGTRLSPHWQPLCNWFQINPLGRASEKGGVWIEYEFSLASSEEEHIRRILTVLQ